jgi:hypothetical protein
MLKEKIGLNAGLVFYILVDGALDVKALKKSSKLTEKDLNLALGWLARESKVSFTETENGDVIISLA